MTKHSHALHIPAGLHTHHGEDARTHLPAYGCPKCDEAFHEEFERARAQTSFKGLVGLAIAICFAAVGGAAATSFATLVGGGAVTLFLMGRLFDH